MKTAPLVISYLRFSTPEQLHGDSLRRQSNLADEWCKQNKVVLTDRLADKGISAFRGKNQSGALTDLLALVQTRKVPPGSILLVEELDRLSRQQPEKSLKLFLDIIESGVTVVTLRQGGSVEFRPGAVDMGRLMMAVMSLCLAHEESAKKSHRLAEAWKAKRADIKEKPLTKMVPSWLTLRDGKMVVDKAKAAIVKKIFRLAADGHGLTSIVKLLNQNPQAFYDEPNKHFMRSYVFKILHNRSVLGEYQPHTITYVDSKRKRIPIGDPVQDYFPAIVSSDLFYAASGGLSRRKLARGRSSQHINLFSGLLVSSEDGSPLHMQNKGCGRRYVSSAALVGRRGASAFIGFPVATFEEAMLIRLAEPSMVKSEDGGEELRTEASGIEGEISALNAKIEKVQESLINGKTDTPSVLSMLNKMDTRKGELERNLTAIRQQVASSGDSMENVYEMMRKASEGGITEEERVHLRNGISQLIASIGCQFWREGRNYGCYAHLKQRNGEEYTYRFHAIHVDTMKRNALGHPMKRKVPVATEFRLQIPSMEAQNKIIASI